jgi:hypothetical protein
MNWFTICSVMVSVVDVYSRYGNCSLFSYFRIAEDSLQDGKALGGGGARGSSCPLEESVITGEVTYTGYPKMRFCRSNSDFMPLNTGNWFSKFPTCRIGISSL